MTEDLIEQAEALLGRYQALIEHAKIKPNAVIFEMIDIREAIIGMMPQLVAEIKRLQAKCDDKSTTIRQMASNLIDLQEQLATWQKIAIKEKANWLYATESTGGYDMMKVADLCNEEVAISKRAQATKELGLQVAREAGYVRRLEEAFLDAKKGMIYWQKSCRGEQPLPEIYEYAEREAQVALEKIRKGAGDDL